MSDFVVDGRFVDDGLSVSVYGPDGHVVEETWFTWDEIEEQKGISESAFTFELEATND